MFDDVNHLCHRLEMHVSIDIDENFPMDSMFETNIEATSRMLNEDKVDRRLQSKFRPKKKYLIKEKQNLVCCHLMTMMIISIISRMRKEISLSICPLQCIRNSITYT